MLRAAICQKNKEKREYILSAIQALDFDIDVQEFRNIYDFKDIFDAQNTAFDIIVLDTSIQQEGDGLTLAGHIRKLNGKVMILFVTDSEQYYAQAFKVFATGYLLYPFDVKEIENCIAFYNQKTKTERRASWMVKGKGGNWCRIFCRNILFVESDNRQVILHLDDGTIVESYAKLSQAEQELPDKGFLRCHQSYIVNLYYVDEIKNGKFWIQGKEIPISRKYQKLAKEGYYDYMFSKL